MGDAYQGYVCWDNQNVGQFMDTEALQVPDHVFMAIHHPMRMFKQSLTVGEKKTAYSQEKLLADFMDARDSFRFVPVLGASGTGKSHLIRWLKARIDDTPDRRVILIPKTGTNLREVIRLILEGMEGEQFDRYRAQLGEASDPVTVEEGQAHLLGNIARTIEYRKEDLLRTCSDRWDRQQQMAAEEVCKGLPFLLNDPHFRGQWLREGGVIERIYDITLGESGERERREELRQFGVEDLPLDVTDLASASKLSQDFYANLLALDLMQEVAVDVLNASLEIAIPQVVGMSGERLMELMLDVRKSLAAQEVELVLLIEDFAKLQGIDRQLLEALIVRPDQAGETLCPMRTALACTTGYYRNFADTVRTRASFRVDLNHEEGKEVDKQEFVARYLNAVRLGEDDIQEWYESGADPDALPSGCTGCPHREMCHDGFGEQMNWGLYPFNSAAVDVMYKKTDAEGFNPRYLIKDVIRHTLEQHTEEIREGRFPSKALHEHFGGLSPSLAPSQTTVQKKDPENVGRRLALIDLWTTENEIVNLHPGIHAAFDLPSLDDVAEEPEPPKEPAPEPPKQPKSDPSDPAFERLQSQLDALDAWSTGDVMDQDLAQTLRRQLYDVLTNRMDWDNEGLLQTVFCARTSSAPFRRRDVNFENQITKIRDSHVQLTLPLEGESIFEVAKALKGMLQFQHHGNWRFEQGTEYFVAYARYVEKWAEDLVRQIRHSGDATEPWSPVEAVVEVLSTGARMAGQPMRSHTAIDHRVNALFYDLSTVQSAEQSSSPWRKLFSQFQKYQNPDSARYKPGLWDLMDAYALCTKGGYRATKFYDVAQFIDVLESRGRHAWQIKSNIPTGLPSFFDSLTKVRKAYVDGHEDAIAQEREYAVAWIGNMRDLLGPDLDGSAAKDAVRDVLKILNETGSMPSGWGEGRVRDLNSRLLSFARSDFAYAVSTAERIEEEDCNDVYSRGRLLGELGWMDYKAAEVARDAMTYADKFLTDAKSTLELDVRQLQERGGADLESIHQKIRTSLDVIERNLEAIEPSPELSNDPIER